MDKIFFPKNTTWGFIYCSHNMFEEDVVESGKEACGMSIKSSAQTKDWFRVIQAQWLCENSSNEVILNSQLRRFFKTKVGQCLSGVLGFLHPVQRHCSWRRSYRTHPMATTRPSPSTAGSYETYDVLTIPALWAVAAANLNAFDYKQHSKEQDHDQQHERQ